MRRPHPTLVCEEKFENVAEEERPYQPEKGGADQSYQDGSGNWV